MQTTDSCRELTDVSRRVAHWLARQPSVGEESITDWLLFSVSERLRSVRYRKFNRTEEGRVTGADWEWWFVSRGLSLGMRVQAKKVNWAGDNYAALAYANRHGLQIEKLREDATRRGLIAFYAFYSDGCEVDALGCRGIPNVGQGEGVFLSDATELYVCHVEMGRSRLDASELLEGSNPLSCFGCCPIIHRDPGVEGLYEYVRQYHGGALSVGDLPQQRDRAGSERIGLHENPPAYVTSLLEQDGPAPDWWEREFRAPTDEVGALLVFDLREVG